MNKYRSAITSRRTNTHFIERFKGKISLIDRMGNIEGCNYPSPIKKLPRRLPSLELSVPYNSVKLSMLLLNKNRYKHIFNLDSNGKSETRNVLQSSAGTNPSPSTTRRLRPLRKVTRNTKSVVYSKSLPACAKLKLPFTCHHNGSESKRCANAVWSYIGKGRVGYGRSGKVVKSFRGELSGVNKIWVKYPCFYPIKEQE
eukprot:TRINITY_DN4932_c0_g1_i1.p1 TRINITY_DN4932_c0_g1~~TRINITY_DN4932_c0_g1_i1.p1  ORF type:complete len:199 (+),score=24.91 TRINITY_DN4932_c0_g1_i1:129-725(+)